MNLFVYNLSKILFSLLWSVLVFFSLPLIMYFLFPTNSKGFGLLIGFIISIIIGLFLYLYSIYYLLGSKNYQFVLIQFGFLAISYALIFAITSYTKNGDTNQIILMLTSFLGFLFYFTWWEHVKNI